VQLARLEGATLEVGIVRFRLRYLQHDLELAEGEFAIGRNATCQLSLADPLVSRRHAVFTVESSKIMVEDCGSRNGVLVNGQKIDGRVRVRPGDKVLIGSQEFAVMQVEEDRVASPMHPTGAMPRVTVDRLPVPPIHDDEGVTRVAFASGDLRDELSIVRRIEGFRVLGSVAEKSLAMGRAEDAERLLASSLTDVIEASRRGTPIHPALAEHAACFAAKLATATQKGAWVDYAIEIYATLQRPAPAVVIDELYTALRKVTMTDLGKVKAYVEALRAQLPSFGPADRFLFQRIEGLERLATLRG
jgi:pSer/pThr/pTyr-binding forkhead associated (FHA) protein